MGDALKVETLIEELEKGTAAIGSIGKGPSQETRMVREDMWRRKRAKEYIKDFKSRTSGHQYTEDDSHPPDKPTTTKRSKITKARDRMAGIASDSHEPSPTNTSTQGHVGLGQQEQPFQLAFLEKAARCYGCLRTFTDKMRKNPKNLILKKMDYRQYTDSNGTRRRSTVLQNTYYHLNLDCVRRQYPMTELSQIVVHEEIKARMTTQHFNHATKFGLRL